MIARRSAFLLLAVALALPTAACRLDGPHPLPAGSVVVDGVPPDACLAYYGPGPCREHGLTVEGSTSAVALWHEPAGAERRR